MSIYNIAELSHQHGVTHAVVCPGSRCAPLILAFARHNKIETLSFNDERSAGYIALGMAQQTKRPVVIVCTSGTAVNNLSPAVSEAHYRQIPLVVFTADRPPEWIDQQEGQSIHQAAIFGKNVLRSFQLPVDTHSDARWHFHRLINEAFNAANEFHGPVHVNVPVREPFYPASEEETVPAENLRATAVEKPEPILSQETIQKLRERFKHYQKVVILVGQQENLTAAITDFQQKNSTVIAGEIHSNIHSADTIKYAEAIIENTEAKEIQPELLITIGGNFLSKTIKKFFRQNPPLEHWHVQALGDAADTFQHLSTIIRTTPSYFLKIMAACEKPQNEYYIRWKKRDEQVRHKVEQFEIQSGLNDFHVVQRILKNLKGKCNLHLANSLSVRYANWIGLSPQQDGVTVYSNRGTSGIDGCTSTALGHALVSDVPNILITGDMAFFYDRNAFWHTHKIKNLTLFILNNAGGGIFDIIDGPSELPEKDNYFITRQGWTARHLAEEFSIPYHQVTTLEALDKYTTFLSGTTLVEIETSHKANKKSHQLYKAISKL